MESLKINAAYNIKPELPPKCPGCGSGQDYGKDHHYTDHMVREYDCGATWDIDPHNKDEAVTVYILELECTE